MLCFRNIFLLHLTNPVKSFIQNQRLGTLVTKSRTAWAEQETLK